MNADEEDGRPMASDLNQPTTPADPSGGAGAPRPTATDVQAYIGRQLRAVYDDVAKQPIPDRFLDLMRQLEGETPRD